MAMTLEQALALVGNVGKLLGKAVPGAPGGGGGGDGGFGYDPFAPEEDDSPNLQSVSIDGVRYNFNPQTGEYTPTGLGSGSGGGGGPAGSSVPYDTVSFGGQLYVFNKATGQLEPVASTAAGGGDAWSDPEFLYGVQQDALERRSQLDMMEREDARWKAQTAIEAAMAQYNAGIQGAQLKAQLQMQAQQLEQQARAAQQEGREGTANIIMQYAQQLRAAEQDPFRLGEYLVNIQRMEDQGGETPLSELIGEGFRIDPQLPDPYADPRWQQLLDAAYAYGIAPPPDVEMPDVEFPEMPDIQALLDQYLNGGQEAGGFDSERAVLDAYGMDPSAAQRFFSQDPEALARMFGGASSQPAQQPAAPAPKPRTPLEELAAAGLDTPEKVQQALAASQKKPAAKTPATPRPTRSSTGQSFDWSTFKLKDGGTLLAEGPLAFVDVETGETRAIAGEAGAEMITVTPMDRVKKMGAGGRIGVLPADAFNYGGNVPAPRRRPRRGGGGVLSGLKGLPSRWGSAPAAPAAAPGAYERTPTPQKDLWEDSISVPLGQPGMPGNPSAPGFVGDIPDWETRQQLGAQGAGPGSAAQTNSVPAATQNVTEAQASAMAVGRALEKLSFVPRDVVETLKSGGVLRPGQAADPWFRKLGPVLRASVESATQQGGVPLADWEFERQKYGIPGARLAVVR